MVHHELNSKTISETNSAVKKIADFIKARGNPYCLDESSLKLRNISSQVLSSEEVKPKLLNFHSEAEKTFKAFKENVYVNKTILLSDKITKFKILPVDYIPDNKREDLKTVKMSAKQAKTARRILNTAKARQGGLEIAVKFDI